MIVMSESGWHDTVPTEPGALQVPKQRTEDPADAATGIILGVIIGLAIFFVAAVVMVL